MERTPLVTPWFDNREFKPVRTGPFEVLNKANPAVQLWRKWDGQWYAAHRTPLAADLCTHPEPIQPDAIVWRGVLKG